MTKKGVISMTYLAVATAINKIGRRDGKYFCAEMDAFADCVHVSQSCKKVRLKRKGAFARRVDLKKAIRSRKILNTLAIFGHGTWRSLPAGGFNLWNIAELAHEIELRSGQSREIRIILYACSCGAGRKKYKDADIALPSTDNEEVSGHAGFAMRLAGALQERGVGFTIFAHLNRGKAAKNPFVVRIYENSNMNIVRRQVIPFVSWWRRKKNPDGRRCWLTWKRLLANDPTFRFEFPFMDQDTIDARVYKEVQ
jgi:hypothetical protein